MNDIEKIKSKLGDRKRRISSGKLYKIKDKEGRVTPYSPNRSQVYLHNNQRYRNIILKARQLGFSTDIEIQALDYALFNSNKTVGVIAQDLDSAKAIFSNKVKFAYDNLPDRLKSQYKVKTDRANELSFSNGSIIRVGTSFRSGTIQFLHISEFGKICAKYPNKAREIMTGALEAVPKNGFVFIESTAEGNEGYFYDMSKKAIEDIQADKKLSKLDYKFHFFPRYEDKQYFLEGEDAEDIIITKFDEQYFNELRHKHGIKLTLGQKKRYIKKKSVLGDDMLRENPSFPDEAFELAIKGAYYEKELALTRKQKRICNIAHDSNLLTYTSWDLGGASGGDDTAIWFFQKYGKEIRIIDYRSGSGYSMKDIISTVIAPKNYNYDIHYLPHDAKVREYFTGVTRVEAAEEMGLAVEVVPKLSISDGINAVRTIFPSCYFDEKNCAKGIKSLSNYRRERDEKNGLFKSRPKHDWTSHGADAFRYLAVMVKDLLDSYQEESFTVDFSSQV